MSAPRRWESKKKYKQNEYRVGSPVGSIGSNISHFPREKSKFNQFSFYMITYMRMIFVLICSERVDEDFLLLSTVIEKSCHKHNQFELLIEIKFFTKRLYDDTNEL